MIKAGLGYKIQDWNTRRSEKALSHGARIVTVEVNIQFAKPEHADEFLAKLEQLMEDM